MYTRRYSEHPEHVEYLLTDKGRALQPVVVALTAWRDRWAAPDGPPIVFAHETCGGQVRQETRCKQCAGVPEPRRCWPWLDRVRGRDDFATVMLPTASVSPAAASPNSRQSLRSPQSATLVGGNEFAGSVSHQ